MFVILIIWKTHIKMNFPKKFGIMKLPEQSQTFRTFLKQLAFVYMTALLLLTLVGFLIGAKWHHIIGHKRLTKKFKY